MARNRQDFRCRGARFVSLVSFYFSPKGRATRFDYWIKLGVPMLVLLLLGGLIDIALAQKSGENSRIASSIVSILLFWPSLAVSIRRCHDRDKSGWFLLIGLIPILGSIWLLIDLGFLAGTPGSNRYGLSVELARMVDDDAKVERAADAGEDAAAPEAGAKRGMRARRADNQALWPEGTPRFGRRGL